MATQLIPLKHPGVYLKEEFLEPLGLSAYRVAKDTGISNMALIHMKVGTRVPARKPL